MPALNFKQILSIVMVVLGVLMASTAQLTDLFGPGTTKAIVGIAGMLNSTLAGILAIFNSQSNTIKDVVNMANDPKSPVQGIITTDDKQGQELAKSIKGPIGSAGSQAATELAKP